MVAVIIALRHESATGDTGFEENDSLPLHMQLLRVALVDNNAVYVKGWLLVYTPFIERTRAGTFLFSYQMHTQIFPMGKLVD